ncbi:MAG TPA: N-6 DNA methylase [Rhizomicrobium sp.]|jgi:hypothetical protein|nr:N-6 DNA methylase [Rhizomicrobium sp.]
MSPKKATLDLLRHLASRPGHDEVKAAFQQLLIEEFGVELGALEFERRVPEVRGRLDALIGRTIFEAKKNLDREWPDVIRRMPDYLADREREEGERFVGIASDGLKWALFELSEGRIVKVKETTLDPESGEQFLAWLDGAVALKSSLPPDRLNITAQLGPDFEAYRRAREMLASIWRKVKNDPAVALKRQLWAQLLKLVYGHEIESDELFFQHTFLVVVAKAIALAVLDLREDDPRRVLSGAAFEKANVRGAAESDFFDWVVADPEGEDLVRRIVAHVRRFRLDRVESDVLKILYESLIDRAERHGLGEYYTPDWLAAKIVRHAVTRPMEQRVLDPACGSGTFLFHAVRNFLREAEEAGVPPERQAAEAAAMVAGVDIHPVAIIIARVTFLLALAPALRRRRGPITIAVYLGDSMQLSIKPMLDTQELVIEVPGDGLGNGPAKLNFPETFCGDSVLFDKAIETLRAAAEAGWTRADVEAQLGQVMHEHFVRTAGLRKAREIGRVEEHAISELGATYETYDKLRRNRRNSIWSYVARNLSRPLALSSSAGWANVVVGNPPWLAFRYMSRDLQKLFRELASAEKVYVGGRFATQNDLFALFTVRAASLYLRSGGKIAFVLQQAALTRGQFETLRGGAFTSVNIAWDEIWTVDASLEALPLPSCVVFGRRQARAKAMPDKVLRYSGRLPFRDAPEEIADVHLAVTKDAPKPAEAVFAGGSPYREAFRQGATLVPRMLCVVERREPGRLGADPSAPFVTSRRNGQEKQPWKSLSGIEHRIEAEFLHPVLMGESILPYRIFHHFEGVVPVTSSGEVLDAKAAANRGRAGLHGWMSRAEAVWNTHSESGEMTLTDRWNYHNELGAQFPIAPLRVVYAKAGTLPAACIVRDGSIIDHKLYWADVSSGDEAAYLESILNSETARLRIAERQSHGQWGARDFDKVMFTLPIPRFDGKLKLHRDLTAAAGEAEMVAAKVALPESVKFQHARKLVRDALAETKLAQRIDALVAKLLDTA